MEVPFYTQYDRLALRDSLPHVRPLPRKFHSCLYRLCACVHGEDHVILEQRRDLLGEASEDAVVEGARGKGEPLGLLH